MFKIKPELLTIALTVIIVTPLFGLFNVIEATEVSEILYILCASTVVSLVVRPIAYNFFNEEKPY